MSDIKSLRFIKGYPPYNTGEVAGFPEPRAGELVRAKVAIYRNAEDRPPGIAVDEEDGEGGGSAGEAGGAGDPEGAAGESAGAKADPTPIPEGFPARDTLFEAGVKTIGAIPRTEEALIELDGIGQGFARRILEALAALEKSEE